jgi:hypothetical protein
MIAGMKPKLLAALVLCNAMAYGCDCQIMSIAVAKAQAEVIFRGTIIELRESRKRLDYLAAFGRDTGKIAVFRVTRVWTGEVGETFEMPAVAETAACWGFWPSFLKVGNDLLVYASRFPGGAEYSTNVCTRTAVAKDTKDFDELGPGAEPKKPREPKSK